MPHLHVAFRGAGYTELRCQVGTVLPQPAGYHPKGLSQAEEGLPPLRTARDTGIGEEDCAGDSSLPSAPRVRVIHPDTATGPVRRHR